jgi:DNA-binding CsgD family transcriptional regulator
VPHPSPLGFRAVSEVKEELEAERRGAPFVMYRDGEGRQRLVVLDDVGSPTTVGRRSACDVALAWDSEVSRLHARFERVGHEWTLVDDGLSRNGSFVNGERVVGRRRLGEGDALRFGDTTVIFRAPTASDSACEMTAIGQALPGPGAISEAQRRVLVALCRPVAAPGGMGMPATNQQIADELFLSVDAVKTHLRALFGKFGIEGLPQNQKRTRLVNLALASGLEIPPRGGEDHP